MGYGSRVCMSDDGVSCQDGCRVMSTVRGRRRVGCGCTVMSGGVDGRCRQLVSVSARWVWRVCRRRCVSLKSGLWSWLGVWLTMLRMLMVQFR